MTFTEADALFLVPNWRCSICPNWMIKAAKTCDKTANVKKHFSGSRADDDHRYAYKEWMNDEARTIAFNRRMLFRVTERRISCLLQRNAESTLNGAKRAPFNSRRALEGHEYSAHTECVTLQSPRYSSSSAARVSGRQSDSKRTAKRMRSRAPVRSRDAAHFGATRLPWRSIFVMAMRRLFSLLSHYE